MIVVKFIPIMPKRLGLREAALRLGRVIRWASGDNVGGQLIFDKDNPVAQNKFAFF